MDRRPVSNAPLNTIWDGRLKATIWQNESEGGNVYHTISLSRLYEDKAGKPQETNSFSAPELLRVAELAREAYGTLRALHGQKAAHRQEDEDHSKSDKGSAGQGYRPRRQADARLER